jgi:hypothetical protein
MLRYLERINERLKGKADYISDIGIEIPTLKFKRIKEESSLLM